MSKCTREKRSDSHSHRVTKLELRERKGSRRGIIGDWEASQGARVGRAGVRAATKMERRS